MTKCVLVEEMVAADVMKSPATVILSLLYLEEEGSKSLEKKSKKRTKY